ncbi:MAG: hypothetical protein ACLR07_00395 [Christensenellales bacterium]
MLDETPFQTRLQLAIDCAEETAAESAIDHHRATFTWQEKESPPIYHRCAFAEEEKESRRRRTRSLLLLRPHACSSPIVSVSALMIPPLRRRRPTLIGQPPYTVVP